MRLARGFLYPCIFGTDGVAWGHGNGFLVLFFSLHGLRKGCYDLRNMEDGIPLVWMMINPFQPTGAALDPMTCITDIFPSAFSNMGDVAEVMNVRRQVSVPLLPRYLTYPTVGCKQPAGGPDSNGDSCKAMFAADANN